MKYSTSSGMSSTRSLGRQVDWKDIKSVEEILTERTGIDCRLQVAVRCRPARARRRQAV